MMENRPKGLIIIDIELVAVKSHKNPESSGWNGWQSIVIETEYGDAWVDKTDENSQRLETHDAMHQTTESDLLEAKIRSRSVSTITNVTEDDRHREPSESLSEVESVEPKVEDEMLSVKMRLTKAISWNQAKFGDNAAENFVLEYSSKSLPIFETLESIKSMKGAKCGRSSRSLSKRTGRMISS